MRFARRMFRHVLDRLLFFLLHVRDFADFDVMRALSRVVNRVQIPSKHILGLVVVAQPQLQAEDGTQRDEGVEHGVVANGPRNAAQDYDSRCCGGFRKPSRIGLVGAISEPG